MKAFSRLLAAAGILAVACSARAADNMWPTPGNSAAPLVTNGCVNGSGQVAPCSAANPLYVTGGGGGGGGSTGSVTAAGTNGTLAQAVQGINGGVPVAISGAISNAADGVATSSTNVPSVSYNYGWTGTVWNRLLVDGSGNLKVSGSLAVSGTTSNGSDGVATSATNNPNVAYNYGFNGTTWDRQRVDGSKNLLTALGAALPAGSAIVGKFGIDQTTPGTSNGVAATGTDGTTQRQVKTTTDGSLSPSTAASGKITRTSTALAASTSTTIAAANANRIAMGVQCGSGGVSIDETGGTLTAAGVGNGTLFIPAGTGPYFTPPVATLTAITAYTATAQTCVVTEYVR